MMVSSVHHSWLRHPRIGALLAIAVLAPASALASPAFGPKAYVVKPGLPLPAIERFAACRPEQGGQLRVENGPAGRPRVTLAVVVLNQRDTIVLGEAVGHRSVVDRAVPLAGSNTLLVWMIGPPGSALALTVTSAGACLDVAITDPPPGAVVPAGTLHVRGTVQGPPDLGVAVNGIPAAVAGGEFIAELQLAPGPTELAAVVTSPDGSTAEARQPLTVADAVEAPVRLLATPPGGIAPLAVGYAVSSLVGITDVKLDLHGSGSVDFEGPSLDGQLFVYDQPGVYVATVEATDIDGQVHSATSVIEVYDRAALNSRLQSVWSGFLDATRAGDVTRAVSLLHHETRDAYSYQLGLLRPQTLAGIDTYLRPIQLVEIGPRGAEYEMLREQDGVILSFAVWFRVDDDGIWRLFRF
jgi:hypothetical protein